MNISRTNSVSGSTQSADSFQRPVKQDDPVKFPAGDVSGTDATTQPTGGEGSHNIKRLRAYSEKIEKRLNNALASRDLTPAQRGAIEKQSEKFQMLMKRLENAYLPGHGGEGTMKNMHSVLGQVTSSLDSILGTAKTSAPQIAPSSLNAATPEQSSGLDTVA